MAFFPFIEKSHILNKNKKNIYIYRKKQLNYNIYIHIYQKGYREIMKLNQIILFNKWYENCYWNGLRKVWNKKGNEYISCRRW